MNQVVLMLGGNQGDVKETLLKTIKELTNKVGSITNQSAIYKTKAWGITDQPDFLNQAIVLKTNLLPEKVMEMCLSIEQILGRTRKENNKWGERIIDIDLIFYNNEIVDTPSLKIPHPFLHQRNFVLTPLTEILPNFLHPVLNKTIKELSEGCEDQLEVVKN